VENFVAKQYRIAYPLLLCEVALRYETEDRTSDFRLLSSEVPFAQYGTRATKVEKWFLHCTDTYFGSF